MLQKNQLVKIEITDITAEGNGVGRVDGMAVFVPSTAIGDIAEVRIVKVQKSFCYGIIESLLTPSKDRITVDCPVFKRCGGCDFRHITYEAEKNVKKNRVEQVMQRIGKLNVVSPPVITGGESDHYRNKAIYPIQKRDGKVMMGFYAKRSHDLIEHYDCKLHPAFFAKIAMTVRDFLQEHSLSIYDEQNHTGLVRSLYLRYGASTGEVMVCLVVNGDELPHKKELITALLALDTGIVSIVLNINREKTNVLLGDAIVLLYGNENIQDTLSGLTFSLSPLSFYQVNSKGAQRLYQVVAEFTNLQKDELLLDLYCGAGTIGLSICHHGGKLIGVEIIPEAIENAKTNAAMNGIQDVRFICGDASQAASQLKEEGISPDVIVIDPPRKGCDSSLIETIVSLDPKRVVMVSCDPATAARDLAIFSSLGYYPEKIQVVDMFGRTNHVECVCLMTRKEK